MVIPDDLMDNKEFNLIGHARLREPILLRITVQNCNGKLSDPVLIDKIFNEELVEQERKELVKNSRAKIGKPCGKMQGYS